MNEKKLTPEKKRTRRRLIAAIIVVSVLAAISYVITLKLDIFEWNSKNKVTSMYSDEIKSFNFYPSDYELDVTTVPEYMDLDRGVHYTKGGYSILVLDEELSDYNPAVRFFVEYFKTLQKGDYETYNTYFTEDYYKIYKPYELFAPQMIYNIEVEELSETFHDDGTTTWTFNVKYMIYRNDGTFRNDIGSNAYRVLYYELVADVNDNVKINYITYYKNA